MKGWVVLREKAQRIVLIGYTNAGKSRLGHQLAAQMELDFCDTDALLVKNANYPSPRVAYQQLGESRFRQLERQQLEPLLKASEKLVIATGGGVLVLEENRCLLQTLGLVVYLHWPFEVIQARFYEKPGVFTDMSVLAQHWQERHKSYLACADFMCDLGQDSWDDALLRLGNHVEEWYGK